MTKAGARLIASVEEALTYITHGDDPTPRQITILSEHMPPSTNGLYANVAGRGRVKSESYKAFRQAFMWDVKRQHPPSIRGHYRMSVEFSWLKRRSNSDLSNRLKGLEDALVEMRVIEDDSLADAISLSWAELPAGIAIRVVVEPIGE